MVFVIIAVFQIERHVFTPGLCGDFALFGRDTDIVFLSSPQIVNPNIFQKVFLRAVFFFKVDAVSRDFRIKTPFNQRQCWFLFLHIEEQVPLFKRCVRVDVVEKQEINCTDQQGEKNQRSDRSF